MGLDIMNMLVCIDQKILIFYYFSFEIIVVKLLALNQLSMKIVCNLSLQILLLVLPLLIEDLCNAAPSPQSSELNIPFENMLGNMPSQTQVYRIAFRPDDGLKNRVRFQEKHGLHGERLIASFGEGLPPGPATFLDDHLINRNNWVVSYMTYILLITWMNRPSFLEINVTPFEIFYLVLLPLLLGLCFV